VRIKKTRSEKVEYLDKIICDFCKKKYSTKSSNDILEIQEFVSVYRTGGYGSVFGDGEEIKVDICQHCFKKLIVDKIEQKV
jgi:antitoxin CcdA